MDDINEEPLKGKIIKVGKDSIYPQWNIIVKLSKAAEIIAYLQNNEGFSCTHRLKNPSKPRPTLEAKEITEDSVVINSESETISSEKTPLKRRKVPSPRDLTGNNLFKYLPGWHVEQCKRYKPKKTIVRIRNRKSQGFHCPAKFAIKLQEDYHHTETGALNVKKFGDMLLMLHWTYSHNHEL